MENMTTKYIIEALEKIERLKHDDETANILEDYLHQSVLKAIAGNMCDDPESCAAEALRSKQIYFNRWCA